MTNTCSFNYLWAYKWLQLLIIMYIYTVTAQNAAGCFTKLAHR